MELSNNQKAFFELIKAGLFPVQGEGLRANDSLFKDVDWDAVYQLAEEQGVVGLVTDGIDKLKNANVSDSLNANVTEEWALQFVGQALQIEEENKAMNAFVASLIEKMRAAGIYTLLVKGQGVAQCYEKPLWRSCGDVDLLLSDDNYEKAKKFLLPLASEVETEYEGIKHIGMTIDGWVVELHGSLRVDLSQKINRELDEIYSDTFYGGNVRSWMNGQTQIFMLDKENDIVYVFVHFLNHFYKEGLGLRQICDWCRLLWTYRDEIDAQKIESRIRKMGLVSEWKAFGALAIEYLGFPKNAMPLLDVRGMKEDGRCDIDKRLRRKAEKIKDFVLKSGNMGHNRDMSYFSKKPYFVRKCISMGRRIGDLIHHARIFPLDSLRFFPTIMLNGVRSAMRGE